MLLKTLAHNITRAQIQDGNSSRMYTVFMSRKFKKEIKNGVLTLRLLNAHGRSLPSHHAFIPMKFHKRPGAVQRLRLSVADMLNRPSLFAATPFTRTETGPELHGQDLSLKDVKDIYVRIRTATWGADPLSTLPLHFNTVLTLTEISAFLIPFGGMLDSMMGTTLLPVPLLGGVAIGGGLAMISALIRSVLKHPGTYRVLFPFSRLFSLYRSDDRSELIGYLAYHMYAVVKVVDQFIPEVTEPLRPDEVPQPNFKKRYIVRHAPNGYIKVLRYAYYEKKLRNIEVFDPLRGKDMLHDILARFPRNDVRTHMIYEHFGIQNQGT